MTMEWAGEWYYLYKIMDKTRNIILSSFHCWIEEYGHLSIASWEAILKVSCIREIDKDTCILKNNDIEEYFRYIYSGVIKSEFHSDSCKFVNQFYVEGTCSYYRKLPSASLIEKNISLTSVTPVILVEIEWSECIKLFYAHSEVSDLALSIMNQSQFEILSDISSVRLLTAKDRYLDLLKNHPSVIMNAKLEDIASYLNITPSSLSRIRRSTVAST